MKRILVIFTHLKLWVAEARQPKLDNLAVKGLICGDRLNPLSPHDVIKLHFTSLKTYLDCPTTKSFGTKIENGSPVHGNFLSRGLLFLSRHVVHYHNKHITSALYRSDKSFNIDLCRLFRQRKFQVHIWRVENQHSSAYI